ncbi:MAG: transglutaminase domain-containing protein [Deltaproteobacteria bacterium]|nr:transglutaminase domain-containing protein [Deltaproteobacteria bacterium]
MVLLNSSGKLRRARPWLLAGLLAALAAAPAQAESRREPVPHEYVAPDTSEDLDLASTVAAGALPAAMETPSGTVRAPDTSRDPEPGPVYRREPAEDARFFPDRDTRRPRVEQHDDPFSPALAPYARLSAFDAVHADYSLYVRDPSLRPLPVGGAAAEGDERFYGDMVVRLRADAPVRIPTVGSGARLLRLLSIPALEVSVWTDGAENWFARAPRSVEVRLVTALAAPRAGFGGPFPDVGWQDLVPVPAQPAAHRGPSARVAAAIGVSRALRPREALARMVEYFRSFAPSAEPPHEHGDIYLDLALSKKGVCRHRAFAFLVTAFALGLPARMVTNDAHAWVEVHDGKLWRRIDLGGAAEELAGEPNLDRPAHVPPPDPYGWPAGRDSGAELAGRQRQAALAERRSQEAAAAGSAAPAPSAPLDGVAGAASGDPGPAGADPSAQPPAAELTIESLDRDLFRGRPLHLQGRASAAGRSCPSLRVDVVIALGGGAGERRIGSLSTDGRGVFDGAVVLPRELPVGDHELYVTTAGGGDCGPGLAR